MTITASIEKRDTAVIRALVASEETYLNLDRYRVKSVHGNYLLLSSNLEKDYVIADELAQLIFGPVC